MIMKKFSPAISIEILLRKLSLMTLTDRLKVWEHGEVTLSWQFHEPAQQIKKYFTSKGHEFCLGYKDIIAENTLLNKEISERTYH